MDIVTIAIMIFYQIGDMQDKDDENSRDEKSSGYRWQLWRWR